MRKDVVWTIDSVAYAVRGVPYMILQEESCIDLDVAVKLEVARELMFEGKIPNDIEYSTIEDLEL